MQKIVSDQTLLVKWRNILIGQNEKTKFLQGRIVYLSQNEIHTTKTNTNMKTQKKINTKYCNTKDPQPLQQKKTLSQLK